MPVMGGACPEGSLPGGWGMLRAPGGLSSEPRGRQEEPRVTRGREGEAGPGPCTLPQSVTRSSWRPPTLLGLFPPLKSDDTALVSYGSADSS